MIRFQYTVGVTFITWGLMLITPLYLNFRLSDAFVVIPIIVLFLLTGWTIIKGKKYSWTLGLVLGNILLVHFAISMFNEISKERDMVRHYETPEIILMTIWSILTLSTLYSVLTLLRKNVRITMGIGSGQYNWTLIASSVTAIVVAFFLLDQWYWIWVRTQRTTMCICHGAGAERINFYFCQHHVIYTNVGSNSVKQDATINNNNTIKHFFTNGVRSDC